MSRRALVGARSAGIVGALLALAIAQAASAQPLLSGHVKIVGLGQISEDDSLEAALDSKTRFDLGLDFRLRLRKGFGAWRIEADYELVSQVGDQVEVSRRIDQRLGGLLDPAADPWLDLSTTIHSGNRSDAVHGFDRLSISYTGAHLVARLGRQALSWGNGLAFRPLDLFDPFAFNALDLEYKPGTDLVYGQWLFSSGADVQAVVIPRRSRRDGSLDSDLSSAALKLHLPGSVPIDLMIAEDWGDTVLGLGASHPIGGAIWQLDATATRVTGGSVVFSAVTNYTTAKTWGSRPVAIFTELYYNGFGTSESGLALDELPADLARRLQREQVFVLNRFYGVGGTRIEWTPLLQINPSLVVNLDDGSAFVSVEAVRDLRSIYVLTSRVEIPLGGRGTEFGGLPLPNDGPLFAPSTRLFVRIARYF